MASQSVQSITQQMNSVMGTFETMFSQTCNQYLAKKQVDRVQTADPSERRWALKELEETLLENGIQVKPVFLKNGRLANANELIHAFPEQDYLEQQMYALNNPLVAREDKIYFAQTLIKACSGARSSEFQDAEEQGTQLFRSFAMTELLTDRGFALERDELVKYIGQHFPAAADRSVSPLMQSAEQTTARREYMLLCERFEDELCLLDRSLDELDYTLGIFSSNDPEADKAEYPFPKELRLILADLNESLCKHASRRADILRGYRVLHTRKGESRKEKILIRRIDFLILYYEYFIAVHEDDNEDSILKLEDVFRSFADHLNPVLERARYAGISAKSMPDVLLILFAYNMVSLLS